MFSSSLDNPYSINSYIQKNIISKPPRLEISLQSKMIQGLFIAGTIALVSTATSTNEYNLLTKRFSERVFSSPNTSVTTPLLEFANSFSFSNLYSWAYLELFFPTTINPSGEDFFSPKEQRHLRATILAASIGIGVLSAFPAMIDNDQSDFNRFLQVFMTAGLRAYSIKSLLNILKDCEEESKGRISNMPLLVSKSALLQLYAPFKRRCTLDSSLNQMRKKLVERVKMNLIFYQRAPKEVKNKLATDLQNAKAINHDWVQKALTPFNDYKGIKSSTLTKVAQVATSVFFSSTQFYFFEEIAYSQMSASVENEEARRFLSIISTLVLTPAIYELIGGSVNELTALALRCSQTSVSLNVGEMIAPKLLFRVKATIIILALLSFAQNEELAFQRNMPIIMQILFSFSVVLLVAKPSIDIFEEVTKSIVISKDPETVQDIPEKNELINKQLITQTEYELKSLLRLLQQSNSQQLTQFIHDFSACINDLFFINYSRSNQPLLNAAIKGSYT